MFVIRMYYARGYIYGVNGIFTQPNISNKGQNSELGWWLYLKWNNHEMLVSWFHDMRWWYHGIMTWPCWFQNWLHQRTHISSNCCTCFGSTYTKIGTIQRRLAWPLRKDDTQNREAFHIFCTASSWYFFSISKNSQMKLHLAKKCKSRLQVSLTPQEGKMSTATCIPRRSPIQVLTGLNLA